MGCCESNPFKSKLEGKLQNQRDKSAPICRKPIFDEQQQTQYQSEQQKQYYSYKTQQFRVSRAPINPPQNIRVQTQQQQSISCPPARTYSYFSNQSFSVPISNQITQPHYVVNQNQMLYHNMSFNEQQVQKVVNTLNQQQQKLFKTTSKAVLNVNNENLSQVDIDMMKDVFSKLDGVSNLNSRKSSKSEISQRSLYKNNKELRKMYDDMNHQLQLLNKLIYCLDDKWTLQESRKIKGELKQFADQVKQLGQMTMHTSFADQNFHLQSKDDSLIIKKQELELSNLSEEENNQLKVMKEIFHKTQQQTTDQSEQRQPMILMDNQFSWTPTSYTNSQQKQSYNTILLSSERMKENNTRMDQLIYKLQNLSKGYKQLSKENLY